MPMLSKLVVVVEDEPTIRMVAIDVLSDAGFEVIEAHHAESALEILHARAADIHLLFTDIHMPGSIDGLALAHHACGYWPWIALLVTSGRARPGESEMPAGSRFLPKPYHPDHLLNHVREMVPAG